MNGPGDSTGNMGEVPSEWQYWPAVAGQEDDETPRRRRFRTVRVLVVVGLALAVVLGGGLWLSVGRPFGHHQPPQSGVVFAPYNVSSTLAPPPSASSASLPATSASATSGAVTTSS